MLVDAPPSDVVPITLAFTGLTATLKNGKQILQDCSGVVRPGHTLALLGSSGAGKTTLLSILANRPVSFGVQGQIYFNGQKAKSASRKRFCSLVTQETAFMGDFTVRETLRFAALFQLGYAKVTNALIDDIMAKVGLTSCADSKIGSIFVKGISGGQQRRLALAMELLKKPSVIFLDEPLTNLDATAAYQIMLELQKLAKQNHTIVFSAHTPSSRLLEAFDELIVLSRGYVVYFGKASLLREYLSGIALPVPDLFNPCDYLMHLLISDTEKLEVDFVKSENKQLIAAAVSSAVSDRALKIKTSIAAPAPADEEEDDNIDDVDTGRPSLSSRVTTMAHRAALGTLRNPGIFFVRISFFINLAFFLGAVFFGTCNAANFGNVRSCISLLIGGTVSFVFLSILSVPFIIDDTHVYSREKHNGAYGSVAFTLTLFLRSLFFTAGFALVASLLIVFMGKLANFGLFFVAVWATLMFAEGYAIMWSMILRDYLIAIVVIMASVAMFMLLSGFFVSFDHIPWVVRWIGYASPIRYSFRAVLEQQFASNSTLATGTVFATGQSTLDFLGVNGTPAFWGDIGILLGMCATCFITVGVVFEKLW
jgi:ABC-type multidrug transport system ATPase subunit